MDALDAVLIPESDARDRGMMCLSGPYSRETRWMGYAVLKDLQRDPQIKFASVKCARGMEIWIRPSERQRKTTLELCPLTQYRASWRRTV